MSFTTGVHLERLYVSSWERSLLLGLRENRLGWKTREEEPTSVVQFKRNWNERTDEQSEEYGGMKNLKKKKDLTYRRYDRDAQFFPVQNKLSFVFDLHVLDEFA